MDDWPAIPPEKALQLPAFNKVKQQHTKVNNASTMSMKHLQTILNSVFRINVLPSARSGADFLAFSTCIYSPYRAVACAVPLDIFWASGVRRHSLFTYEQLRTRTSFPACRAPLSTVRRADGCSRMDAATKPAMDNAPVLSIADSPQFRALFTPQLVRLAGIFTGNAWQIRVVGGAVRDILLGKHPKDIDLSTDATPDEVMALLTAAGVRHIPTGLQHGTVTAVIDGENFEVTTLRIDRETDGRHAVVDFTRDWREDANRRDLTINAMSVSFDGMLYDYFGGVNDLAARRVVFVGDPTSRIREDYLRILRYFRFHARINETGTHDEATIRAIADNVSGLSGISGERIWAEMSKILSGPRAPQIMSLMRDIGLLGQIGFPPDFSIDDISRVHGCSSNPVTVLVSGVDRPDDFESICLRWRLSNAEKSLGVFIMRWRGPQVNLKLCKDLVVDATPILFAEELLKYHCRMDEAAALCAWTIPDAPVNGSVLAHAGYAKGPELGKALRDLREAWKQSDFTLTREQLLSILPPPPPAPAPTAKKGKGAVHRKV